jgi:AbrB family looped-hinge helix DNA binding protein
MKLGSIQIDGAGRVVLPKAVREKFQLSAGDRLHLEMDEEGIRLEPAGEPGKLIREGSVLVFTGETKQRIDSDFVNKLLGEDRNRGVKALASKLRKK